MSTQTARQKIMARLHASGTEQTSVPETTLPTDPPLDPEARIARLAELMTAMRTEVHIVAADRWTDTLKEIACQREWKHLLYGPGSPIAPDIESAWASDTGTLPELTGYTDPVETFKPELFQIDAGITSVRGGVADTGALVLWPDEHEPRLISLVPPVHVAVLDAHTIAGSLAEMMAVEHWADGMPTNALLISGPSKTADIEFTLVFGVHGPKELVVLIRQ